MLVSEQVVCKIMGRTIWVVFLGWDDEQLHGAAQWCRACGFDCQGRAAAAILRNNSLGAFIRWWRSRDRPPSYSTGSLVLKQDVRNRKMRSLVSHAIFGLIKRSIRTSGWACTSTCAKKWHRFINTYYEKKSSLDSERCILSQTTWRCSLLSWCLLSELKPFYFSACDCEIFFYVVFCHRSFSWSYRN